LLAQAGIDPKRRAETLTLVEWGVITETLKRPEATDHSTT
jgi:hypothetical protein